jgi:hypothetical protein
MLERITQWLETRDLRRRQHAEAWRASVAVGPDRQSPFQREAQRRLGALLQETGAGFGTHIDHAATKFDCIELTAPAKNIQLWIFPDQVDVQIPRKHTVFEYWDAATPQEMLRRIEDYLRSVIGGA